MHVVGCVSAALFSLLAVGVSVQDEGRLVKIPCTANTEAGLQYRKISWYKVEDESDGLTGLVLKDLRTQVAVLYKYANQSYEVESDYSLVLLEVTVRDCGQYRCTLWPPVGHYIQDGDYDFYPLGCTKPQRHSKAVTDEKTQQSVNYTQLILIISSLLVSAIMWIGYLMYRKKKCNQKTKQVYLTDSF